MNEEKKPSREIVVNNGFLSWLDNFWYHYKWVTLGVLAALIILLVCLLQTCSTQKADTTVVYAGPTLLSVSESEQVSRLLGTVLPEDYDKNGETYARLSTYEIYSEDQIRKITAETDAAGERGYVDRSRNTGEYQTFTTYQQTGESTVYLLDPWLYESLPEGYLRSVEEVVGYAPEGMLSDGCGVRLGDTALYREYAVLRLLPEDTVVCMMAPFVWGGSSDEERYAFEEELYRALVTFGAEDN